MKVPLLLSLFFAACVLPPLASAGLNLPPAHSAQTPVACVDWTTAPAPTPMVGPECDGTSVALHVIENPDGTYTIVVQLCSKGLCRVYSVPLPVHFMTEIRHGPLPVTGPK